MAKIRVFKSIENKTYVVIFVNDPKALSSSDVDAMQRFGEPEINMGGTFTYTNQASQSATFTLPDKFTRIRADFPQRVEFDSTATTYSGNIDAMVASYITAISTRFTKAFVNPSPAEGETLGLRDRTDSFTGEQIVNV